MTDVGCAIDTGAFNQRTAGMCNGCRGRVTRMWIEAMSKSDVRAARSCVRSLRVKTTSLGLVTWFAAHGLKPWTASQFYTTNSRNQFTQQHTVLGLCLSAISLTKYSLLQQCYKQTFKHPQRAVNIYHPPMPAPAI